MKSISIPTHVYHAAILGILGASLPIGLAIAWIEQVAWPAIWGAALFAAGIATRNDATW